jgi:rubrerythrin
MMEFDMTDRTKTLKELVKLDYDAIEAYDAAIERLEDRAYAEKLAEFREDHVRHTENLGNILRNLDEKVPDGPDLKMILTEGKVVIAGMGGDKAILRAMQANEKVTNTAYEKALEANGMDAAARGTLEHNLADERRHKAWIDAQIERLKDEKRLRA